MELSVIIVSYNVRAFLEKCLISVYKAIGEIDAEVLVVDNNSIDDSVNVVKTRFPQVQLITNENNVGFSRANNQAIEIAKGRYVLILNPDTVLSEDTLRKCIDFAVQHPDFGAIGVRMYDGTGTFLPESKRGLPSPVSSFFKVTGINNWFPRSNLFNHYYLGGLDPDESHEIEVLTGAFMFVRKAALDKVGYFDEDYFMYGEDIDLSYRLLKGGFKNYYLPSTSIIHYKGESTKRSSIAYVRTFYNAMLIFVAKHYSGPKGFILKQFLNAGIFVRGGISGLSRLLKSIVVPLVDLVIIAGSIWLSTVIWSRYYFNNTAHFEPEFYRFNLVLYTVLWMIGIFISSGHGASRKLKDVLKGVALGGGLVILVYSLLDDSLRTSRAVIFLSMGIIGFGLGLWTAILSWIGKGQKSIIGVVARGPESERVMELINRVNPNAEIAGVISTGHGDDSSEQIGVMDNLPEIVRQYKITELIFAAQLIDFAEINRWMAHFGGDLKYKIASRGSKELVGSDSRRGSGGLHAAEVSYAINNALSVRNKRLFDCFAALVIVGLSPVALVSSRMRVLLKRTWNVLKGDLTWVSYDMRDRRIDELPRIKQGVLPVSQSQSQPNISDRELHMVNYLYAKEYSIWRDIERMFADG